MELLEDLIEAKHTIDRLRRQNEILGAKVEVMESFMCVLHTKPAEHLQAASVDIGWKLAQHIANFEAPKAAKANDV